MCFYSQPLTLSTPALWPARCFSDTLSLFPFWNLCIFCFSAWNALFLDSCRASSLSSLFWMETYLLHEAFPSLPKHDFYYSLTRHPLHMSLPQPRFPSNTYHILCSRSFFFICFPHHNISYMRTDFDLLSLLLYPSVL